MQETPIEKSETHQLKVNHSHLVLISIIGDEMGSTQSCPSCKALIQHDDLECWECGWNAGMLKRIDTKAIEIVESRFGEEVIESLRIYYAWHNRTAYVACIVFTYTRIAMIEFQIVDRHRIVCYHQKFVIDWFKNNKVNFILSHKNRNDTQWKLKISDSIGLNISITVSHHLYSYERLIYKINEQILKMNQCKLSNKIVQGELTIRQLKELQSIDKISTISQIEIIDNQPITTIYNIVNIIDSVVNRCNVRI